MAITIKKGLSGQYFSGNIPDMEIGVTTDRLGVIIDVSNDSQSWTEIFSETLYPIGGIVTLRDLSSLVQPWAEDMLSLQMRLRMLDYADADETITIDVVYCDADLPTTCEEWTRTRFLTLLDGEKTTDVGRLEYLHYIGSDAAQAVATYDDGSEQTFNVGAVGGNSRFTTIDVSPGNFVSQGKNLVRYEITAGDRHQDYIIDPDHPDCAPVLLFVNSFGVDELAYCFGLHTKAPTFARSSAYIDGLYTNYSIVETRTFKADTGVMNEEEAFWFGEVFRSKYIRIVTFNNGQPNVGRAVVITDSKSEQTNDPAELIRFTFSYQYAQKNQNVVYETREGRIFDNTFDYTFD